MSESSEIRLPEIIIRDAVQDRVDADTKNWIRTKSDEKASQAGMVFVGERGQFVCDWIESHCVLYEGSFAGKPLKLIPYQREFVMRGFSWIYKADDLIDDPWIRRFSVMNLLAAKKNGKTPFLAALELYATCADGEQGNNVYNSAKNGKQAGRAQGFAISMVEMSPLLSEMCTINRSTLTITHRPSKSRLMILTGDDTRGAQANEGVNGSIFIDELHVYDEEIARRTSRLGISRREPLNIAVSTAGDDPSVYGYRRVEYGREVNAGVKNDLHVLHVEYAAPQKVTNEEIADNIIEYAKAANPAWGHIIRQSELLSDYQSSKDRPRDFAAFKQYRLNIWTSSISPWLNSITWEKGKRVFSLADMAGRTARLGIDLSRTRDMTSVVLQFDEDDDSDSMYIWPLFWLPRKTAENRKNLYDYLGWSERGWLTLTDGNVVDFNQVEDDTCKLIEDYNITVEEIYFDQHYAEEITQRMAERLSAERIAVSQSLMTLSPLAKEVERRIEKEVIFHPGNEVMDWQIGHVEVRRDGNDNIRPEKPDPNSGKSIDGVAAMVDVFAGVVGGMGSDDDPSIRFS